MPGFKLLLLCALFCALPAAAAEIADVEIYDRDAQRVLPIYRHHGRDYVAGQPGHEYEIRVRNQASRRVLAVASVDGVNVVSGETARPDQTGYVLDRYGKLEIAGWRKSLERVAAFYFTTLPDSYAAQTGRPDNVGVIGVALFREQARRTERRDRIEEPKAAAPPAEAGSASRSEDAATESERIGTGHGRGEDSAASYTSFERESKRPTQTIVIHYDSYQNLLAQGVIPKHREYADRWPQPQPFPGSFVPDP